MRHALLGEDGALALVAASGVEGLGGELGVDHQLRTPRSVAMRSRASSTLAPMPWRRWVLATAILPIWQVRLSSRTMRPVPTQRPSGSKATTWSAL